MFRKIFFLFFFVIVGLAIWSGRISNSGQEAGLVFSQKNISTTTHDAKTSGSKKELADFVRVVDGDTLVVELNGQKEKVRLIGINTPEVVDPRKPVECFGKEAKQEAERIFASSSIKFLTLENDPTQTDRDKYGRLLRYVYLPDGTDYGKKIIFDGFAYEYTYKFPYQKQVEYKKEEDNARTLKRGLWAENICTRTYPLSNRK